MPISLSRLLLALLLVPSLLGLPGAWAAAPRSGPIDVRVLPPTIMWTHYWDTRVRDRPNGLVLTALDRDQQVRVTGSTLAYDGSRWLRVDLWGALDGWIRADLLAAQPIPQPVSDGVPVAPNPVGPHAPMPLPARGVTAGIATVRAAPTANSARLLGLPSGTPLLVGRWATDVIGQAWYEIQAPAYGWISAEQVALLPGGQGAGLAGVRGLGMWCTPPVLRTAPPQILIAAARQHHMTHLYLEVGTSRDGFWGADTLRVLLPLAHAAHIAVIAWVYPYLDDLPRDVAIAEAAARFRTPTGDRPDGLLADVEQNMAEPYVRAYGQVLRATLGPRMLMAIATYPPQTDWGRIYPFRTVAQSWDLVAPMDYWHTRRRSYSADQVYAYVAASITGVRTAAGRPALPVEVVGQTFDVYANGVDSPTAIEIAAAGRAARDGGATAISFFEWNHATPAEWDALAGLHN